jgi:hypothetical protein
VVGDVDTIPPPPPDESDSIEIPEMPRSYFVRMLEEQYGFTSVDLVHMLRGNVK